MKQATEKDIRVAVEAVVALARAQGYTVSIEHVSDVDVVTVQRLDQPHEAVTHMPAMTPNEARVAMLVATGKDDRKMPR